MKRRTVLIAGALAFFSITGVSVAHYLQYDPAKDFPDSHGHIWRTDMKFRGEVRLYDADGHSMGSNSSSGPAEGPVAATVTVDGYSFPLTGTGRRELRSQSGILLGYAELVPQTDAERKRWQDEYEHRGGIQERLRNISVGATDGWGAAVGLFGSDPHRLSWRLGGVGRVNFYRADNGHLVYFAKASAVDAATLDTLRKQLAPEAYRTLVDEAPPTAPVFTWTLDGKSFQHVGTDPFTMTLPNGVVLTVQIDPSGSTPGEASSVPPAASATPADGLSDYERRSGVQEPLRMAHGADDGFGSATGYFGEASNRLSWRVNGVARVNFYRADNGHLVYCGTAFPGRTGEATAPDAPLFSWTLNGQAHEHTGYGRFPTSLPDGTELTVELKPLGSDNR